ncbi:MAG: metallophosphoesterase family protein [Pseudomonadota bacterium]
MKTAILSDIHSNLEALERVCEHAAAIGAQHFACLGDCVGYGADPVPTLTRIMALPGLIAVRGNHDTALFRDPGLEVPADIRQASDWTRAQLLPAQLEFLAGLPLLHREAWATYVHASAHEPEQWDYLRMPDQIHACLEAAGTPIVFIGHVHMPCVFYETTAGTVRELLPSSGVPISLSPRTRYVINVGSVGQPRDGNNATGFVLYDEDAATVTFHRLAYHYQASAAKIRAAGLSPFFADRLARGY